MNTPSQIAPPNLNATALVIENYARDNALTPCQLLQIFNNGIVATLKEREMAQAHSPLIADESAAK
jgi:hypothetical protein